MKYRMIAVFALLIILMGLGGCRYRISLDESHSPPSVETHLPIQYAQDLPEEPPDSHIVPPDEMTKPDPEVKPPDDETEPPLEYIPVVYVDAIVDDFSPLVVEIEDDEARRYGTEDTETPENDDHIIGVEADEENEVENIITIEQPSDVDDDAVIGADGGVVGLITTYSTLLRQGVNSIFPCQLLNIYAETPEELVTVARGSEIYRLMEDSGGINVSSRLTADGLAVTADWVVRRNPDIIVKFVDGSVLGNGITSTHAASDMLASMMARPDWSAIEAVRNNRIILLSEQMLDTEATRLSAQLLIAYMMYPELFDGININSVVARLMEDMDGIYFSLSYSS